MRASQALRLRAGACRVAGIPQLIPMAVLVEVFNAGAVSMAFGG